MLIKGTKPLIAFKGGGVIETYRAWCDYYNKKSSEETTEKIVGVEGDLTASSSGLLYSTEVVHYLEDLIRSESRDLDISQFPGIELSSDITFDLLPLFNSLKHNTFFQRFFRICCLKLLSAETCFSFLFQNNSLTIKNIERKDLVSLTASVMRTNRLVQVLIASLVISQNFR